MRRQEPCPCRDKLTEAMTNKVQIPGNPSIPTMSPLLIPACNFPYSVSFKPEHLQSKLPI
jgi:hypothetical protein